jgi:threonine dehydratase
VIKAWDPGCLVIGCQPAASCVMKDSVAAGRVVHEDESGGPQGAETLSDATAGGIEPDSLTLVSD